jgi:hypothetical protein
MEIEMQIGDQPIKSTMQQTMTLSWRINEVDDEGVASTTITIDRIKMAMKSPVFQVDFDTADEDKQQGGSPLEVMTDALKNLVGLRYDVKMAPTGEILDVSVPEETREALKKQFNSIPGMQQMADAFTDNGMKNMASQSLQTFPEEPVSPGDTWIKEGTQNIPQFGEQKTKTVFEYIGPKEVDGHTIEQLKATMETEFEGGAKGLGGAKFDIQDHQMSGTIQFDANLGRMTRSEFDMDMEVAMDLGQQSMQQHITGKITATIAPAGENEANAETDSEADAEDDS